MENERRGRTPIFLFAVALTLACLLLFRHAGHSSLPSLLGHQLAQKQNATPLSESGSYLLEVSSVSHLQVIGRRVPIFPDRSFNVENRAVVRSYPVRVKEELFYQSWRF